MDFLNIHISPVKIYALFSGILDVNDTQSDSVLTACQDLLFLVTAEPYMLK